MKVEPARKGDARQRRRRDEQAVVEAAIALFLETGEDSTCAQIAERSGIPLSRARIALPARVGYELECHRESRPSYSKAYPTMESGVHVVWVYGPTRSQLRLMLAESRK